MNGNERTTPETLIRVGLRELARHRPDLALAPLRAAVDGTPAACADELSRALYWLSVALLRLDRKELALKSLASAQKLRRRGIARHVYLKRANEYGMPRRPSAELDDFYAFASIRLADYLTRKPRSRFDSEAEREAVMKMVAESWKVLRTSGKLAGLECGSKLQLFRSGEFGQTPLGMKAFASRGGNSQIAPARTRILSAAFGSSAAAPCVCGSGLPYHQCCGRTKSLGELQ